MKDPIVEEIRKIRDAHAAKFQFDLHVICEDLRKQEKTCSHPVGSLPPKRILKKPYMVIRSPETLAEQRDESLF